MCFGNCLAVQWLGLSVFTAVARVQSLVGVFIENKHSESAQIVNEWIFIKWTKLRNQPSDQKHPETLLSPPSRNWPHQWTTSNSTDTFISFWILFEQIHTACGAPSCLGPCAQHYVCEIHPYGGCSCSCSFLLLNNIPLGDMSQLIFVFIVGGHLGCFQYFAITTLQWTPSSTCASIPGG